MYPCIMPSTPWVADCYRILGPKGELLVAFFSCINCGYHFIDLHQSRAVEQWLTGLLHLISIVVPLKNNLCQ